MSCLWMSCRWYAAVAAVAAVATVAAVAAIIAVVAELLLCVPIAVKNLSRAKFFTKVEKS